MFSDYRNKKVTVIGLGRSGLAAADLLKWLGATVFISEKADNDRFRALRDDLGNKGIRVEIGRHTIDFIRGKDLVVVSPGVGSDSESLIWADELHIPVISEIELASSVCPATVIAITGTNGKTTVTTLIAKILQTRDVRAFALGNIGAPFSAYVRDMEGADYVSLEVSSFQLERIDIFKPRVAVILNFTPDHLDKEHRGYNSMSEYLAAKKRIFMNQDESDYLVLNEDDPAVKSLAKETKSKAIFFSAKRTAHNACLPDRQAQRSLNPNHLAAMAVASIFGISEDVCLEFFRNFKGVEHRLEQVRTVGGVEFINDSKATNVDSTIWALESIRKPAILIAGGRDKNLDYNVITDLVKEKVKMLILIGEAKEKMGKAFRGVLPIQEASSLEEAVEAGYRKAAEGDCVLLSPMCASFDMFTDYEHRGRCFKEIVNRLKD